MAKVHVRIIGVCRVASGIKEYDCEAETLGDALDYVRKNSKIQPFNIKFDDTATFVNNEKNGDRNFKLKDGDEVWFQSTFNGER